MKYSQPFRAPHYGAAPCSRVHCHSPKPAPVPSTHWPISLQMFPLKLIYNSTICINRQTSRASKPSLRFVSMCSFWAVRVPEDGFSCAVQRAKFFFAGIKVQQSCGSGRIQVDHNTWWGGGVMLRPIGFQYVGVWVSVGLLCQTYICIVDHPYTQFRPAPDLPKYN